MENDYSTSNEWEFLSKNKDARIETLEFDLKIAHEAVEQLDEENQFLSEELEKILFRNQKRLAETYRWDLCYWLEFGSDSYQHVKSHWDFKLLLEEARWKYPLNAWFIVRQGDDAIVAQNKSPYRGKNED